jgi:hypothetical protein
MPTEEISHDTRLAHLLSSVYGRFTEGLAPPICSRVTCNALTSIASCASCWRMWLSR